LGHPNGGRTRGPGNPIKMSRTSEESFSCAPLLGGDTDAVMSELLDMDEGEIQALKVEGVIG
jgi:CoA:oxalate CoA-transferase